MITIAILLFLLLGVYTGARRGLVLQLVHLVGYLVILIFAFWRYLPLSRLVEMYVPYPSFLPGNHLAIFSDAQALELDQSFYQLFSFIVIMAFGWLLVRIVTAVIKEVTHLPIIKQFNTAGGAILGFVFHYVTLFVVLYLLAMVPLDSVQRLFEGSSLAKLIVTQTPLISGMVTQWLVP